MSTNKKLIIIGAGSVGGFIASNFSEFNLAYELIGFLDDDETKIGNTVSGIQVLGKIESIFQWENISVIIGIAFPAIKIKIFKYLQSHPSVSFPSIIHPSSWISNSVKIGKGVIIYPNCSINYGSVIEDFVVMNMNCALGHHTYVGKFSALAPGVKTGGHTRIEEGVDLGIGSSTKQGVIIGKNSIIGGQAMVISDIPPNSVAYGVPAKVMKKL